MREFDSGRVVRKMLGPIKRRLERLLAPLIPEGDLATQTIRSGFWEGVINVSDRLLQLLVLVVLARLLAPEDFGLMGIALLTMGALNRFSQLGVNQALIYNRDENIDRYLNTVWTLKLGRGILLAAVAVAGAPFVASFFGEPRVTDLVRFMALPLLVDALTNPGTVYFVKDLQFHKKFVYKMSYGLANFCVALGFALVYENVWALAFGFLAAKVAQTIASYRIHSFRPYPRFNASLARELIGYGKWITGTNIIYFFIQEGDDLVIGWLVSATALGFYQMAYRIGNAPSTEVADVIGNVIYSTFSKLQDNTGVLRDAFVRTVQITSLVSFPMTIGIVVVSPVFVRGVLGEQWLPMVTTMQVLALYGLLLSLTVSFHRLWKALGRPDLVTKIGVLRLVGMAIVIIPAANRYGLEGVAFTVLGAHLLLTVPVDIYLIRHMLGLNRYRLLYAGGYPFLASLLMGAVVFIVRQSLETVHPTIEFTILVGVGIVSYIIVAVTLMTLFGWNLQRDLETIVKAFRT